MTMVGETGWRNKNGGNLSNRGEAAPSAPPASPAWLPLCRSFGHHSQHALHSATISPLCKMYSRASHALSSQSKMLVTGCTGWVFTTHSTAGLPYFAHRLCHTRYGMNTDSNIPLYTTYYTLELKQDVWHRHHVDSHTTTVPSEQAQATQPHMISQAWCLVAAPPAFR